VHRCVFLTSALGNVTFCWPCIMLWFLVNDQRDAQFFTMCLFLFLFYCAGRKWTSDLHTARPPTVNRVTVTRGCIDTICLSWWWALNFRPAHNTATDTEWQLPEVVLTQFVSPDDEHWTSDLHTTRPPTQSDSYQRIYWHNLSLLMMSIELPFCTQHDHRHRVTVTRGCNDAICLSWWWAGRARNM
jgi:hypothetical protein